MDAMMLYAQVKRDWGLHPFNRQQRNLSFPGVERSNLAAILAAPTESFSAHVSYTPETVCDMHRAMRYGVEVITGLSSLPPVSPDDASALKFQYIPAKDLIMDPDTGFLRWKPDQYFSAYVISSGIVAGMYVDGTDMMAFGYGPDSEQTVFVKSYPKSAGQLRRQVDRVAKASGLTSSSKIVQVLPGVIMDLVELVNSQQQDPLQVQNAGNA